jgi:hypothetical protein
LLQDDAKGHDMTAPSAPRPAAARIHRLARWALAPLLLALMSGCSTLFPKNIDPPVPVFTDDTLTGRSIAAQADDSLTLMAGMEKDLVTAWLALTKAPPASETELANRFLNRGISLLDARCDQYFHALGRAAQRMSYGSKALGLTSGVVAALQGLTGVASRDIALTGSGLGFLGASSQAYGEVFIFSPEVSSVQSLVAAAQAAVKGRIEQMAPNDFNKGTAISLLQDYEKTCEVHTIRRLVNESLVSAQPVAAFSQDEQFTALRLSAQDSLAVLLKVDAVNDDQLAALYGLAYKSITAAPERAVLANVLAGFSELLAADGSLKADSTTASLRGAIQRTLRSLVAVGSPRLESDLAALRKRAAVAAVTSPGGGAAPGVAAAPRPDAGPVAPAGSRRFATGLTVRVPPAAR